MKKKLFFAKVLAILFATVVAFGAAGCGAKVYTVTFDAGYTGGVNPKQQEVVAGSYAQDPGVPGIRAGYIFLGWFEEDADEPFEFAITRVNSNLYLTALWERREVVVPVQKYTITYDYQIDDMPVAKREVDDGTIVEGISGGEHPSGYEFGGWHTDPVETSPFNFATTKITQNITLYAHWIIPAAGKITVTFDLNFEGKPAPESVQIDEGTAVAEREPSHTPSGKEFAGWHTDPVASSPFTFTTELTENTTLYAHWRTPDATTAQVTFNLNYTGAATPESATVDIGDKVDEPTAPSRAGWEFKGWHTHPTTNTPFSFDTTISTDIVLYAHWEEEQQDVPRTVEFNLNIQNPTSTKPQDQTVVSGNKATKPSDPTHADFVFLCWYNSTDNTKAPFDFNTGITQNTTLNAKWGLKEGVAYLNLNGEYQVLGLNEHNNLEYMWSGTLAAGTHTFIVEVGGAIDNGTQSNEAKVPFKFVRNPVGDTEKLESGELKMVLAAETTLNIYFKNLTTSYYEVSIINANYNDDRIEGTEVPKNFDNMGFYAYGNFTAHKKYTELKLVEGENYLGYISVTITNMKKGDEIFIYHLTDKWVDEGESPWAHYIDEQYPLGSTPIVVQEDGTVTVYYNIYNKTFSTVKPTESMEGAYIVGDFSDWQYLAGLRFTAISGKEGHYVATANGVAGDKFKIAVINSDKSITWYGGQYNDGNIYEEVGSASYADFVLIGTSVQVYRYPNGGFSFSGPTTVIYKNNDTIIHTEVIESGSKAEWGKTHQADAPDNMEFSHWALEGSTDEYGFNTDIVTSIVLVAVFKNIEVPTNKVTITYETDHGTAPSPIQINEGGTLSAAQLPTLPNTDTHSFQGWFIGDNEVTTATTFSQDTTITAKWTEIPPEERITVTYETDYGVAPQDVTLVKNGTLSAAQLPTLTHDDYNFEGWFIGDNEVTTATTFSQDTTIKAKWGAKEGRAYLFIYSDTTEKLLPLVMNIDEDNYKEYKITVDLDANTTYTFKAVVGTNGWRNPTSFEVKPFYLVARLISENSGRLTVGDMQIEVGADDLSVEIYFKNLTTENYTLSIIDDEWNNDRITSGTEVQERTEDLGFYAYGNFTGYKKYTNLKLKDYDQHYAYLTITLNDMKKGDEVFIAKLWSGTNPAFGFYYPSVNYVVQNDGDVTLYFNTTREDITDVEPVDGAYIVGDFGDWTVSTGIKFVKDESYTDRNIYKATLPLSAFDGKTNYGFKVVLANAEGTITTWYGESYGNIIKDGGIDFNAQQVPSVGGVITIYRYPTDGGFSFVVPATAKTVTYKVDNTVIHTEYVTDNNTASWGEHNTPLQADWPEGKEFSHWGLQEGGDEYFFNAPVTSDLTLVAVFKDIDPNRETYTLKFITDHGTAPDDRQIEVGAAPNLDGLNLTDSYFKLLGWFDGEDKEIAEYTETDWKAIANGTEITFTAKWEAWEVSLYTSITANNTNLTKDGTNYSATLNDLTGTFNAKLVSENTAIGNNGWLSTSNITLVKQEGEEVSFEVQANGDIKITIVGTASLTFLAAAPIGNDYALTITVSGYIAPPPPPTSVKVEFYLEEVLIDGATIAAHPINTAVTSFPNITEKDGYKFQWYVNNVVYSGGVLTEDTEFYGRYDRWEGIFIYFAEAGADSGTHLYMTETQAGSNSFAVSLTLKSCADQQVNALKFFKVVNGVEQWSYDFDVSSRVTINSHATITLGTDNDKNATFIVAANVNVTAYAVFDGANYKLVVEEDNWRTNRLGGSVVALSESNEGEIYLVGNFTDWAFVTEGKLEKNSNNTTFLDVKYEAKAGDMWYLAEVYKDVADNNAIKTRNVLGYDFFVTADEIVEDAGKYYVIRYFNTYNNTLTNIAPTESVAGAYLAGEFSGWGANSAYKFIDTAYIQNIDKITIDLTLNSAFTTGTEFKIIVVDSLGNETWYGWNKGIDPENPQYWISEEKPLEHIYYDNFELSEALLDGEGKLTIWRYPNGGFSFTAPVEHRVTINLNGGKIGESTSISDIGVFNNEPVAAIGTPSKEGYDFVDWFYMLSETETKFEFDTTQVTSDITVYAKWTIKKYTVTIQYHDGTDYLTEEQEIKYDVKHGTLVRALNINKNIEGYSFVSLSVNESDEITGNTTIEVNLTIKTYTVTFKYWNGTEDKTATVTDIPHGTTIDSAKIPNDYVSPDLNKKFDGWYDAETEGTLVDLANKQIKDNITLWAYWVDKDSVKITLHLENGTQNPVVENVHEGTEITKALLQIHEPTKAGYEFLHWSLSAGGEEYTGYGTGLHTDITLYAVYIKLHTVTFSAEGSIHDTKSVKHGEKVTAALNPSLDHFVFLFWYLPTQDADPTAFEFENTTIESDITLYAHWGLVENQAYLYMQTADDKIFYPLLSDSNYTVTVANLSGEIQVKLVIGKSDNTGNWINTSKYTLNQEDEGITHRIEETYSNLKLSNIPANSTLTFTATAPFNEDYQLTITTGNYIPFISVVLMRNDGTGDIIDTHPIKSGIAFGTIEEPIRVGYSFVEFNTDIDGTGTKLESATTHSANTTYYAIWKVEDDIILRFIVDGEEDEGNRKSIQYNAEISSVLTDLPSATRTGWTFAGWEDSEGVRYSTDMRLTADTELFATFETTPNNFYIRVAVGEQVTDYYMDQLSIVQSTENSSIYFEEYSVNISLAVGDNVVKFFRAKSGENDTDIWFSMNITTELLVDTGKIIVNANKSISVGYTGSDNHNNGIITNNETAAFTVELYAKLKRDNYTYTEWELVVQEQGWNDNKLGGNEVDLSQNNAGEETNNLLGYYMVGNFTGWKITTAGKLSEVVSGSVFYGINYAGAKAGDEFYIVEVTKKDSAYEAKTLTANNWKITTTESLTLYFNSSTNAIDTNGPAAVSAGAYIVGSFGWSPITDNAFTNNDSYQNNINSATVALAEGNEFKVVKVDVNGAITWYGWGKGDNPQTDLKYYIVLGADDNFVVNSYLLSIMTAGKLTIWQYPDGGFSFTQPVEHTVTFKSEGETVETQYLLNGDNATAATAPTAPTGKQFKHWALSSELNPVENAYSFATSVVADIELVAVFIDIVYQVSVQITGIDGVQGEVATQNITYGNKLTITLEEGQKATATLDENPFNLDAPITSAVTGTVLVTIEWKTYTVTFNNEDGAKHSETTVTYNNQIASFPPLTMDGHTLSWWDVAKNVAFATNTQITADITIQAVFTINSYNLNFYTEETGGTLHGSGSANYDTTFSKWQDYQDPSKEGYDFAGWFYGTGDSKTEFVFADTDGEDATKVKSALTIYATWTIKQFNVAIEFHFEDSKVGDIAAAPYNYGTLVSTLLNPAPPTGYQIKEGGAHTLDGEVILENETITAVSTIIIIVEKVKYSVSITYEDSEGAEIGTESLSIAHFTTVQSLIDGYMPTGYQIKTDGAHTLNDTTIVGNETITAVSTIVIIVEKITYTVVFNYLISNGEDSTTAISVPVNVKYNEIIDSADIPTDHVAPNATNTVFNGWWTAATNGTQVDLDEAITGNLTLYAQWIPADTVTVSFDLNGSTEGTAPEVQTIDTGNAPTKPADPTRTGYTFRYWSVSQVGAEFDFDGATVSTNTILYAIWELNTYTVTIELHGESGIVGSASTLENTPHFTTVASLIAAVSAPENYVLDTNKAAKLNNVDIVGGEVITGADVIIIFITKVTHVITIIDEGGTNTNTIIEHGGSFVLPVAADKTGYTFSGWKVDGNSEDLQNTGYSITVNAPVTIEAVYTIQTFVVTFDAGAGRFSEQQQFTVNGVEYNTTVSSITPPTYANHSIEKWFYTVDDDPTEIEFVFAGTDGKTATVITSDMTVYAKWVEDTFFTISFNSGNSIDPTDNIKLYGNKLTSTDLTAVTNKYQKDGFNLVWKTEGSSTSFDLETEIDSDLTLFAEYEMIEGNYYLHFDNTFHYMEATTTGYKTEFSVSFTIPTVTAGNVLKFKVIIYAKEQGELKINWLNPDKVEVKPEYINYKMDQSTGHDLEFSNIDEAINVTFYGEIYTDNGWYYVLKAIKEGWDVARADFEELDLNTATDSDLGYYVYANFTGWKISAAAELKATEFENIVKLENVALSKGDEFVIMEVYQGEGIEIRKPDNSINNYVITEDGIYTIYYNKATYALATEMYLAFTLESSPNGVYIKTPALQDVWGVWQYYTELKLSKVNENEPTIYYTTAIQFLPVGEIYEVESTYSNVKMTFDSNNNKVLSDDNYIYVDIALGSISKSSINAQEFYEIFENGSGIYYVPEYDNSYFFLTNFTGAAWSSRTDFQAIFLGGDYYQITNKNSLLDGRTYGLQKTKKIEINGFYKLGGDFFGKGSNKETTTAPAGFSAIFLNIYSDNFYFEDYSNNYVTITVDMTESDFDISTAGIDCFFGGSNKSYTVMTAEGNVYSATVYLPTAGPMTSGIFVFKLTNGSYEKASFAAGNTYWYFIMDVAGDTFTVSESPIE